MKAKSTVPMLAVLVSAGAIMAAGASASGGSTLVIRHQVEGCHSWSANGDAYKATQAIKLQRGASLSVTNNDVMPHKLVQVSGPAAKLSTPAMSHMGASSRIVFAHAGVYKFKTVAGEDYPNMAGMKTIGEDNVLRLTVTVS